MKYQAWLLFALLFGGVSPLYAECSKSTFRLAIDIGHDVENFGAKSARGEGEYWFNKRLAHRLHEALQHAGYRQSFILNDEEEVLPLYVRTKKAADKKAEFFLSIHHDSAREFLLGEWEYRGVKALQGDRFSGHSLFFSKRNPYWEKSLGFAKSLGDALLADNLRPTLHHDGVGKRRLFDSRRGIYRYDPLIVLHSSRMPAVLFEGGVILNRDDEILLRSTSHQDRLIRAIRIALDDYLDRDCEAG